VYPNVDQTTKELGDAYRRMLQIWVSLKNRTYANFVTAMDPKIFCLEAGMRTAACTIFDKERGEERSFGGIILHLKQ
jgi:hypothetical protein